MRERERAHYFGVGKSSSAAAIVGFRIGDGDAKLADTRFLAGRVPLGLRVLCSRFFVLAALPADSTDDALAH